MSYLPMFVVATVLLVAAVAAALLPELRSRLHRLRRARAAIEERHLIQAVEQDIPRPPRPNLRRETESDQPEA